jgi:DNA-binding NarL/FixJ family response regulator
MPKIRILIVDDHAILRDGIRTLLERQPDIEVISDASNGREAVSLAGEFTPDIILMDIAMPEMNGLEATQIISKLYPQIRILILTQHDNREFITPILQAGACGYVLKKSGGRELIGAIRKVYEEGAFLEPTITRHLLNDYAQTSQTATPPEVHLTEREKEVLNLLFSGKSNKEIALDLGISPKTVSVHRSNIMKKLDVHNIFDLLYTVSRYRLLDNIPSFDFTDPLKQP